MYLYGPSGIGKSHLHAAPCLSTHLGQGARVLHSQWVIVSLKGTPCGTFGMHSYSRSMTDPDDCTKTSTLQTMDELLTTSSLVLHQWNTLEFRDSADPQLEHKMSLPTR